MTSPVEELTKEKSLLDIFLQCRIYFLDWFNLGITVSVLLLMVGYMYFGNVSHSLYVEKIRTIADAGLTFVGNILGFLIAGFTIFATFSDKNLFVEMAVRIHPKYNISYLKYTFFAFMYVFIVYLLFGSACLLVKLFADKVYIGTEVVKLTTKKLCLNHRYVSGSVHALLGTWFFYLIVILKAFVFNVYHVVVTRIRWDVLDLQSHESKPTRRR